MPTKKTRAPPTRKKPTTSIAPTPPAPAPAPAVPYSPFAELDQMARTMNRWIADAYGIEPFSGFSAGNLASPFGSFSFRPVYSDIEDTGKALVVRSELPGVKKEEVEVSVREGLVQISAESASSQDSAEGSGPVYRERSHASFYRAFRIPEEIDADRADAAFQDGVLTLTLPKRAPTEPPHKTIPVH